MYSLAMTNSPGPIEHASNGPVVDPKGQLGPTFRLIRLIYNVNMFASLLILFNVK